MTQTYQAGDISILITCYKEGDLLLRAVDSVRKQSIQGFEVLIINDCSPDLRTNEVCKELELNQLIKCLYLPKNGGSAVARNAGLALTKNPLIIPLDGDDILPIDTCKLVLEYFNRFPDADFLFGDYLLLVPETGSTELISCRSLADNNNKLNVSALARDWKIIGQLPFKRNIWKKVEGFKEEFSHSFEDVIFWRDVLLNGYEGMYVPQILYKWFRSESGKNSSLNETDYLPVRVYSLPFYDRFHPEYGKEMRQYIYRYYAARLMYTELTTFISKEGSFFSKIQVLKARIMRFKLLYKILRTLKNRFTTFIFRPTDNRNNSTK